jgi:hypothetical protein
LKARLYRPKVVTLVAGAFSDLLQESLLTRAKQTYNDWLKGYLKKAGPEESESLLL